MRQTEFFIILSYFLHFYPPNNPENQYFEKMKQGSREAIILHKCTKNHDHMMYASWDMEHYRQNFFAILGHFLPLYPTNNQGNQNLEKMKNPADIIILHVSTINENMIYGSWDIECDRVFFLILDHFLPFSPPENPENQNF